jgi:hypothetical protein
MRAAACCGKVYCSMLGKACEASHVSVSAHVLLAHGPTDAPAGALLNFRVRCCDLLPAGVRTRPSKGRHASEWAAGPPPEVATSGLLAADGHLLCICHAPGFSLIAF